MSSVSLRMGRGHAIMMKTMKRWNAELVLHGGCPAVATRRRDTKTTNQKGKKWIYYSIIIVLKIDTFPIILCSGSTSRPHAKWSGSRQSPDPPSSLTSASHWAERPPSAPTAPPTGSCLNTSVLLPPTLGVRHTKGRPSVLNTCVFC